LLPFLHIHQNHHPYLHPQHLVPSRHTNTPSYSLSTLNSPKPSSPSSKLTPSLPENLTHLSTQCAEFLIHAADNEGLQRGIDESLISTLASYSLSIPITYAGGGRNLSDLDRVKELSGGKVDLTLGSCLDVFGGSGCGFEECVEWNRAQEKGV